MKRLHYIILPFLLLISGCEKYTYPELQSDPLYPTVILKPDETAVSRMRFNFRARNIFVQSSLDEFGFTNWGPDFIDSPSPAPDTTVGRSEAIFIAKMFLIKNSLYTGVTDTSAVTFNQVFPSYDVDGLSKKWFLVADLQKVDTAEVKTYLHLQIINREVNICIGNWYPSVYIPRKFNFTLEEANATLLGKVFTHWGWSGPFDVKVTQDALDRSTSRLVVRPIQSSDRIELNVAWEINIPDVWYKISVDVMTGKTISTEPTIVF